MTSASLAHCLEWLASVEEAAKTLPKDSSGAELFTRPFLLLHAVSDLYAARTAMGLVLDLGWEPRLRGGATLDELLEGLRPPSRIPPEWVLEFLVEKSLLRKVGPRYFLDGPVDLNFAELREILDAEVPGHNRNLDLLDAVRSHIMPYFTQGKSGDSCLFDLAVFPLWLDYFRNENIIYRCNNAFTFRALKEYLVPGCRILELGGGAGSFAQHLAQEGARLGFLANIAEYRFTDVAPAFLRRAQRSLKELAPGLPFTFGSLDINRPLDEQGLSGEAFDIIVGINVLHVARELPKALEDLRRHLKPGGHLTLGECVKTDMAKPIYLEFFVKFMVSFTDVVTDPILRPHHGFLTPEAWVRILETAGYSEVREIPPVRPFMERFPSFNVGAFSARA